MSRKIIPFVVAFILVCLVMAVSAVFAFSGAVTAEKFGGAVTWSQPYATAESMKVINLLGDEQAELFIQNTSNVSIFDGTGKTLLSQNYQNPTTTLGDVNGDNKEDIVVFYLGDQGYAVDVISDGKISTLAQSLDIGLPARVIVVRFASGPEIVLGDTSGGLLALSLSGQPLWAYSVGSEEIRGM
ncbi:MAG TPA: VCBS repeat-containing protein, partial [Anaerolineales bacterium]|nr:VCBS repeat-containing protein [Anaerolineales bacterium]